MADKLKQLLLIALGLGIVGDLLFKDAGLGLNVALFGFALALASLLTARSLFIIPFLAFGAMFAIRDSAELRVANFTGMSLSLGAAMVSHPVRFKLS